MAANSVTEQHYRVTPPTWGDGGTTAVFVSNDAVWPILDGDWVRSDDRSKWISPAADPGAVAAPGQWVYSTTFVLDVGAPATAVVAGVWTSDNQGVEILINGMRTCHQHDGVFDELSSPFRIESGFLPGTNRLSFIIHNADSFSSPTGLRVRIEEATMATAGDAGMPLCPQGIPACPTGLTQCDPDGGIICGAVLASDPLHCGRCNHSCEGATCTNGMCDPQQIATAAGKSEIAAGSGTTIYWTVAGTAGSIMQANPDGTSAARLGNTFNTPSELTLGGSPPALFFMTDPAHDLMKLNTDGTALVLNNYSIPGPLAVYGTFVCYGNNESYNLNVVNTDGTGDERPFTGSEIGFSGITADATSMYWTRSGVGGIWSALHRSTTKTQIVSGLTLPKRITNDGTTLYWLEEGSAGRVWSRAIEGGTPAPLATDQNQPERLIIDGDHVVWTARGAGTVSRTLKDGAGSVEVIASGLDQPVAIAADANAVYVATWGTTTSTIYRIMK